MPPVQEQSIFGRVDKHIDHPDRTWTALRYGDREQFMYTTHATPLRPIEMELIKRKLSGERQGWLDQVKERNEEVLTGSERIGVVLDGRLGKTGQGWLGDMMEASRLVPSLREAGKKVTLFASHPDIFQGKKDTNVDVVAIPKDIPGAPWHPWNTGLLEFLPGKADTFIFPMNAHMPILIQLNPDGSIKNTDTIDALQAAINPDGKVHRGINVRRWSETGIHQLQALQFAADLMGIENAQRWKDFPPAYLYPDWTSFQIAHEVMKAYDCLPEEGDERIPLFLHPGVATDKQKVVAKYYPEAKWEEVVELTQDVMSPLIILKPVNPEQYAMSERLASFGRRAGMKVCEVPIREVEEKYGWTLGAFVAFLKKMSEHQGMMVGVDSMPAGHLAPAIGMPSVVLGNQYYTPMFFSPPENSYVVMPSEGPFTSHVKPEHAAHAITKMAEKIKRESADLTT